jgi:ethanolamine utilization cobalamin adenosyltransferase
MSETELKAGVRVSKEHPRIAFRGALDSLEADILEAQFLASRSGEEYYVKALGEALDFTRELMSAEVNERAVVLTKLFGFSLDELHEQSHKASHRLPDYTMGELPLRLNTLRTRVREAELLAVKTCNEENNIAHALTRLSSAVYWLFCKNAE